MFASLSFRHHSKIFRHEMNDVGNSFQNNPFANGNWMEGMKQSDEYSV